MSLDSFLNLTCTIEVKAETQDAAGQKIISWTTAVANVKCRIDAAGGGEIIIPTAVFENTTHILFLRNPTTITLAIGTHRISLGGEYYNILLVKKLYGFSDLDHLELLLEIVK